MSRKYKVYDQFYPHFITSTVIHWIDLFTRNRYREVIMESLAYCRANKGLLLYAYCLMTNHFHAIVGTRENRKLEHVMRDFKSFTSHQLRKVIESNPQESRKEWMLKMMHSSGYSNKSSRNFQLWQHHYHPVQLDSAALVEQKIEYIHMNPVKAGFVIKPEDYLYSIARNFAGLQGVIEIDRLF